jgi:hypothetical protein
MDADTIAFCATVDRVAAAFKELGESARLAKDAISRMNRHAQGRLYALRIQRWHVANRLRTGRPVTLRPQS